MDRNGYHGNSGIPNSGYRDNYQGDPYERRERPPSYTESRHYPSAANYRSGPAYPHDPYQANYPHNDGYQGYESRNKGYRPPRNY